MKNCILKEEYVAIYLKAGTYTVAIRMPNIFNSKEHFTAFLSNLNSSFYDLGIPHLGIPKFSLLPVPATEVGFIDQTLTLTPVKIIGRYNDMPIYDKIFLNEVEYEYIGLHLLDTANCININGLAYKKK